MIPYIDRQTGEVAYEKVYYGNVLKFLYANSFGEKIRPLIGNNAAISYLYGSWQNQSWTKGKIKKFIAEYDVDPSEFLDDPSSFASFNDFFIRKLKPSARPIAKEPAVIPADGRYQFFENVDLATPFQVKNKKLNLAQLLQDPELAKRYAGGSVVFARLCPTDYHRFHFPVDCIPNSAKLINGNLNSVNPIALMKHLEIFWENKRMLTLLASEQFGQVAYVEIGATLVGTIVETYTPFKPAKKGDEKGYFSFGGSSLIILFEPGKIKFSPDLLSHPLEIRCLMGQYMGNPY